MFDELIIEGKLKPFVALTKSFASSSVVEQVCFASLLSIGDASFIQRRAARDGVVVDVGRAGREGVQGPPRAAAYRRIV